MKKLFVLFLILILLCTVIVVAEEYTPDGCLKSGGNGAEFCDDEKDYHKFISGGGPVTFHVHSDGGGTFFIAEASAMEHCQDFGTFDTPPFKTVATFSPSEDGKSITLPPAASGMYTLGTYGGNKNEGYVCPGGSGGGDLNGQEGSGSSGGSTSGSGKSSGGTSGGNAPGPVSEGVCSKDVDLDCRRSDKVTSEACKSAVSPLYTYTACPNQKVSITYNIQTLECGDELGLRIAKYDGAGGWTPLEDSNVVSNGDGTGTVTATTNSDATFAVIATGECVPQCYQNVYDYPDPVLGGSSITLGACGSAIPATEEAAQEETQDTTTETLPEETCFEKLTRLKSTGTIGSELFWERCEESCNGEDYGPTADAEHCCATGCQAGTNENPYTTPSESFALPDLDTIAPALFIIRRDECNANQGIVSSDQKGAVCPKGYQFGGSFKIGNEEDGCNGDQQYTGIAKTSNGYTTATITKGWVDLCTKNQIAYLTKARDECLVKPLDDSVSLGEYAKSAPDSAASLYCPKGSVVCGGSDYQTVGREYSRRESFTTFYCCETTLQLQESEENLAAPSGQLASAYCSEENSLATGARFGPSYEDENEIDQLFCSKTPKAQVLKSQRTILQSETDPLDRASSLFCERYGPDYAVCGGINNDQTGSALDIGSLYCCQIKETLTPCKPGYVLTGTIKVNNEANDRCNVDPTQAQTEYGWTAEGAKIISGHVGICVKSSEIEQLDQPLLEVPESVTTGTVGTFTPPEHAIPLGRLTTTANYEQAIFPTLSSTEGEENQEATLESGTIGFYVKLNHPLVNFCGSASFDNGTCTEELCVSTDGTFACKATTEIEDAVQDYYAYVCDFTGCPSSNFTSGNNKYYGTGNYQICSSSEACGLVGPSSECVDVDTDGYCSDVDCDDNLIEVNPDAAEICDGIDNDCDLSIDEDFDLDNDTVSTCATVPDCDDTNGTISPLAGETCGNSIDENCDGNATVCPTCENDGTDEDLDGVCSNAGDCDDGNNTIYANATEFCDDGIDQDCDGSDNACPPEPQCTPGVYRVCYPTPENKTYTYHQQCGEDQLWGVCEPDYLLGVPPNVPTPACTDGFQLTCPRQQGVCAGSAQTCTGSSWPGCSYANIPGYSTTDLCGDYLDNNCDGSVDENCPCIEGQNITCGSSVGICEAGTQLCKNAKWQTCTPKVEGTPEIFFDQKDNDCDGAVDEGFDCSQTFGIGFNRSCGEASGGVCKFGIQQCTDKLFLNMTVMGICQGSVNPGQEICDAVDNDCDGSGDEGCACTTGQKQSCGLGVGICGTGHQDCINSTWSVCLNVTQPQTEKCGDLLDNDCDGSVDENCPCAGNQTSILCSKQLGVCNGTKAMCVNGKFEDCNAIYDDLDDYEVIEQTCNDKLDNDCDNSTDDNDPGQCGELTGSDKCSDGTLVGQCVNRGKESTFCNSLGNLVELCSTCDADCEPGISVCNINGECKDLPTRGTGGTGGTEEDCNYDGVCDSLETTACSDCSDTSGGRDTTSDSGIPWLWIILGIILLGIIVGGAYYLMKRKKKPDDKKPLTPTQIRTIEQPAVTQQQLKQTRQENDIKQLQDYITRSLKQGKKLQDIKDLCKKAGWNDQEINQCLGSAQQVVKKNPEQSLQDLENYAIVSFKKGLQDRDIRKKLLGAGWKSQLVDKAILNAKIDLARQTSQQRPQPVARNSDEEAYADKKLNEMLDKKPENKNSGLKTTTVEGNQEYILDSKKGRKAKKK